MAEAACAVGADGTVRGTVAIDLDGTGGTHLELLAPPGARALAAAVDGRPVRPREGGPGRWIVPIGDGPALRVELLWADPTPADAAGDRRIEVPLPSAGGVPALVTIRAAAADRVDLRSGPAGRVPTAELLADRLDRRAESIRRHPTLTASGPSTAPCRPRPGRRNRPLRRARPRGRALRLLVGGAEPRPGRVPPPPRRRASGRRLPPVPLRLPLRRRPPRPGRRPRRPRPDRPRSRPPARGLPPRHPRRPPRLPRRHRRRPAPVVRVVPRRRLSRDRHAPVDPV